MAQPETLKKQTDSGESHGSVPGSNRLTGRRVTWLGMIVNVGLGVGKILIGVFFASQAILADGLHSMTDLVTDAAVLLAIPMGDKPADPCHPYGHRRIHTLVAMFVGLMLLVAAGLIGYRAVESIRRPAEVIRGPLPLVMAVLTIPLKEALFRLTLWVGRREQNPAIRSNAWHHRTDAMTSLAAGAGIAGAMFLGGQWAILDGLTALVLAAFLFVAAGRMIYSEAGELIDQAPSPGQISAIEQIVDGTPDVRSYHAIRARKVGGKIDMDLHVLVDPDLTVRQGHEIARRVRMRLLAADDDVQQVIVHIEPAE